ncbi:MAG: hypothetical protein ACE5F9_13825 [Phycisphaerae bacterium]
MSLRSFHIFFIVVAIIAADVFGVWAIRDYRDSHSVINLALGVVTLAGGLAMVAYGIWFIRKMDRANIH